MIKKYILGNGTITMDGGILLLRICTAGLLFYRHGYEKVFGFHEMLASFPDPLGLGNVPSFIFALLSDSICAVLIAIGLLSRVASLIVLINLLVAFFVFHHGEMNDHGEAMILYGINVLFLFLAGPGKFSLDAKLKTSSVTL